LRRRLETAIDCQVPIIPLQDEQSTVVSSTKPALNIWFGDRQCGHRVSIMFMIFQCPFDIEGAPAPARWYCSIPAARISGRDTDRFPALV
jgi:hypothetical protein